MGEEDTANERYIVLREITGAHKWQNRLELIAVMNKEKLINEQGEDFVDIGEGKKYFKVKDERSVVDMLYALSKKSDKAPMMEKVRADADSEHDYQRIWGAQVYARETHKEFPNYAFLGFPLGKEDFVAGLIYGFFNVVAQE